jgi:hypothetical protein
MTRAAPLEVRVRIMDLAGLRRYLRAIARVADHGAKAPDPREVLAAAWILKHDVGRGLERAA